MDIKQVTPFLSVSSQLSVSDLGVASARGFRTIINNRPDGEGDDQPGSAELASAAAAMGLNYIHMPVLAGQVTDKDVAAYRKAQASVIGPVLGFCRTGTRAITLWALAEAPRLDPAAILRAAADAGYDLSGLAPRLDALHASGNGGTMKEDVPAVFATHQVLIVGGGAAGIAVAASMRRRDPTLDIAIIEPGESHYYQPGWTLVGGGVFQRAQTRRAMASVMPDGVRWIHAAVAGFLPDQNAVVLEDGERVHYQVLVAAPGIKLDWSRIEGLAETLGKHGVTSNYKFDMAAYTWELVQNLKGGRALFTQPPMPIKCAGAPQKAMYLACDHWRRTGRLQDIDVQFHNAGGVLFGVSDYVPALTRYVQRYDIDLRLNERLVAVDGAAGKAWFDVAGANGETARVEQEFDMMHVCPPQCAPDFVSESPLANEAGWIDVDPQTLQHKLFGNIFALGDASSSPNAKTAAAVRKQAPTVAVNALAVLRGQAPMAVYDGYGSCPLTVERGKIVLAEFGYGGKLLPTFPTWLIDGRKATRLAWLMKEKLLPALYFDAMLKGREWMARPNVLSHRPAGHEAEEACQTQPPRHA